MSLPNPKTSERAPTWLEPDGSFPALHFDNASCANSPANGDAAGRARRLLLADRPGTGERAAADRLFARSRYACSDLHRGRLASPDVRAGLRRQRPADGMQPYAANYGGHQFGHWAGQLGDGRAITLGEYVNAAGERLGAAAQGRRADALFAHADGRAVLRSSIREFLCSEAMHHLGVPTTRALSLVADRRAGRARHVLRRPSAGRARRDRLPRRAVVHPLRQLRVAGVARRCRTAAQAGRFHHPARFSRAATATRETLRGRLVRAGLRAHGAMVAHWMRVGFVHGVMNTDNMSILGLTIDYGPYGWIDNFDPDWTPNTTDAQGRRTASASNRRSPTGT